MKKKVPKIALVLYPLLPVPSIKGGAVEELITILAEQNEIYKKVFFEIYCIYDKKAKKISSKWKFSKVRYYKQMPFFYHLIGRIFKKIFGKSIYPDGYFYPYVMRRLKKRKYDYVIAENGGFIRQFSELKKKYNLSQLIYHIHKHDLANEQTKYNFGKIIGVSDFVTKEWIRTGKPAKYISSTVYNCVKTERFLKKISQDEKNKLRKKLGFSNNDFVIIFTGRILEVKGVFELMQAVVMCKQPHIKLMLVGGNFDSNEDVTEYEKKVYYFAKKHSERIILTGYVDNWDLYKYYQIANLQCAPSLWEEAAGLIVIEGMLSELPLIVTNSGGMVEYVNTKSALFVDKGEDILKKVDKSSFIENLSIAIDDMYNNPFLCENMGKYGKERGKLFNPTKYYEDFLKAVL